MSEPMSSVDIEDVLSSIRRLVSEDLRPAARQAKAEAAAAAPTMAAEKLILTPALRVTPEEAAAQQAAAEEAISVEPTFHSIRHVAAEPTAASIESVVTVVSAGVDAHGDDFEAILGDPAPQFDHDLAQAFGQDWPLHDDGAAPVEGDFGPEAPFVNVVHFDGPVEETVTAVDFDGADLSADHTQDLDAGPSDDSLAVEIPEAEARIVLEYDAEVSAPVAEDAAATDLVAEVADPEVSSVWDQAEDEVSAVDKDFAEPVATEAATDADTAWADAAEADVIAELSDEIETEAILRMDSASDFEERAFDEEMMRDLVRDMIREELQGTLGERITRNVRKLVRAEIARALAVRDFE